MASSGFQIGQQYRKHDLVPFFVRNAAPFSGLYNGDAPFGCLALDMVGGVIYQNTGTIDATTWAVFGVTIPSGAVLPAVVSGANLPAADPHVVGQLWANSGVVTVSAG